MASVIALEPGVAGSDSETRPDSGRRERPSSESGEDEKGQGEKDEEDVADDSQATPDERVRSISHIASPMGVGARVFRRAERGARLPAPEGHYAAASSAPGARVSTCQLSAITSVRKCLPLSSSQERVWTRPST